MNKVKKKTATFEHEKAPDSTRALLFHVDHCAEIYCDCSSVKVIEIVYVQQFSTFLAIYTLIAMLDWLMPLGLW